MMMHSRFLLAALAAIVLAAPRAQAACAGDCNGDGMVTVSELITGVNIALGSTPAAQCASFDANGDRQVAVNELVAAVASALSGCPFTGQYTARVDVGDGETGLIRLQVAADGSATGTLSVGPTASRGRAALRLDIPLLNLVGSVDLDSGAFHLTGTATGPGGDVPIDVSGVLPERPGLSGTVDLAIGDQSFGGSIVAGDGSPTPTATATRPPVTATPTFTPTAMPANFPTPPGPGCDDSKGSWSLTFHDPNGTNSYVDLGPGLAIRKGSFTFIPNTVFGGGAVPCSLQLGDTVRRVQLAFIGAVTQGATIPLGRRNAATFDYIETPTTNPLGTRGWRADSGSLVIDQLEGNTVRFHIVGAVMSPEPSFSFQTPATGTMIIDAGAAGTLQ
ncbi:MAG: hypothetical protein U0802_02170 [Candidatus Binatia bacterium]